MKSRKHTSIRGKQLVNHANPFSLTEESKKLFEEGLPGQGFLGLLDIETGKLYLTPGFHHNDGMLRPKTKNYLESRSTRGGKAQLGPLMRAAIHHNIAGEDLSRVKDGKLIGFGVWKSGSPLRIIQASTERSPKNYVPFEFILEKSLRDRVTEWRLYQVLENQHKNLVKISDVKGLREALNAYEKSNDRTELDNIFSRLPSSSNRRKIKFVKLSSSSMNSNAFLHDDLYLWSFFVNHSSHLDHGIDVKREVPFDLSARILQTLNNELSLREQNLSTDDLQDVLNTSLVHPITVGHWKYQLYWDGLNEQEKVYELMQNVERLFNLEKIAFKGHIRYLQQLWANRETNDFFARCEKVPFLIFLAAFASQDQDPTAKKYYDYHYDKMLKKYGHLIIKIAEGFDKMSAVKMAQPLRIADSDFLDLVARRFNETIKVLLEQPDCNINVNIENKEGMSPLMLAIDNDDIEAMKILIDYDKSSILHETSKFNPVEVAIMLGKHKCLKYLLDQGANPNLRNREGEPPLFTAALYAKDFAAMEILLAAGTDINAATAPEKMTLLMIASANNNLELARFLLDRGADTMLKNEKGMDAFSLSTSDEMRNLIIERMKKNMLDTNQLIEEYQNKQTPKSVTSKTRMPH